MELSKEEKQAMETFKKLTNYLEKWNKNYIVIPKDKKYYKTILNLIEKQQKQLEELRMINAMQKYRIEVIDERELMPKSKISDEQAKEIMDKINLLQKIHVEINGKELSKILNGALDGKI